MARDSELGENCLTALVLGFIIAVLVYSCESDDTDSEPSPRPAVTLTETVAPPDLPETLEEEEAGGDSNGGTGSDEFDGQVGIQFGYACSPVGALGIAEDGRPAKCFMGKDGRARWGYDSNRG